MKRPGSSGNDGAGNDEDTDGDRIGWMKDGESGRLYPEICGKEDGDNSCQQAGDESACQRGQGHGGIEGEEGAAKPEGAQEHTPGSCGGGNNKDCKSAT